MGVEDEEPALPPLGTASSWSTVQPNPPASPAAAVIVDPTYAWCLALLPLALLGVQVVLNVATGGATWPAYVVVFAGLILSLQLASLDSKRLAQAGVHVEPAWAFLAGIAYLIVRTKRARSTPAIPVVAIVLLAVLVGVSVLTYQPSESLTGSRVAPVIQRQLHQQLGGHIKVRCPDYSGHKGDTFTCTAREGSRTAPVTVTLLGGTEFRWRLGA